MQETARDVHCIPGSGRFPGGGNGNPLQSACPENAMDAMADGLQPTGSQRVRHDWTHLSEQDGVAGSLTREWIYGYIGLIHAIVQQKPTYYNKAIIFQFFKKMWMKEPDASCLLNAQHISWQFRHIFIEVSNFSLISMGPESIPAPRNSWN